MATEKQTHQQEAEASELALSTVNQDLKNSILIISMVANLAVFTLWVILQVTSQYDSAFSQLLFGVK